MEKLEVKRKSKDLLGGFTDTPTGAKLCPPFTFLNSMNFIVCTDLSDDRSTKVITASADFNCSPQVKTFEYSESGFEQACEWLDEKRLEFIKELL